MYDLLENWLRHKSDMVNIEAARAICDMRNVTATELYRPVAGSSVSLSALASLAAT
jgi:coatomer protein complex subunit gamma